MKNLKNTFRVTSILITGLFALASCTNNEELKVPPPKPPVGQNPDDKGCKTNSSEFNSIYSGLVAVPGNQDVVTYDSEIHSYDFMVKQRKVVCSIGYASIPAMTAIPYKIEIFDYSSNSVIYAASVLFANFTSYHTPTSPVVLNPGVKYSIRRIQTLWAPNIGNTIGRLVKNPAGNISFPQSSGDLTIIASKFYQNAGTQQNWAIPYINIVFQ